MRRPARTRGTLSPARLLAPLLVSTSFLGAAHAAAQDTRPRLQVPFVTDQADAVLAILDKRAAGAPIRDEDWRRLYAAEGYIRLKQREQSLRRPLNDSTFRAFVTSAELLARAASLRMTLEAWKRLDMQTLASRAFAYLPVSASIRAKVYPAIKPQSNSFVFEPRTDPAIFLYLDPDKTPDQVATIIAHELHHIGVGSVCPSESADTTMPVNLRTALAWMGGFAEGRAVLAAAGGPDVHPHAVSDSAERAVWDRDVALVSRDIGRMETFFRDLLDGKLTEEQAMTRGMTFIATADVPQGAFYTLGWLMSAVVERRFGRARLVASLCDPRMFLADYDRAAALERERTLPRWSREFLQRIGAHEIEAPPANIH